eukprot:scaffold310715_cov32-Tisochrysis_lutea.AAC.1
MGWELSLGELDALHEQKGKRRSRLTSSGWPCTSGAGARPTRATGGYPLAPWALEFLLYKVCIELLVDGRLHRKVPTRPFSCRPAAHAHVCTYKRGRAEEGERAPERCPADRAPSLARSPAR